MEWWIQDLQGNKEGTVSPGTQDASSEIPFVESHGIKPWREEVPWRACSYLRISSKLRRRIPSTRNLDKNSKRSVRVIKELLDKLRVWKQRQAA